MRSNTKPLTVKNRQSKQRGSKSKQRLSKGKQSRSQRNKRLNNNINLQKAREMFSVAHKLLNTSSKALGLAKKHISPSLLKEDNFISVIRRFNLDKRLGITEKEIEAIVIKHVSRSQKGGGQQASALYRRNTIDIMYGDEENTPQRSPSPSPPPLPFSEKAKIAGIMLVMFVASLASVGYIFGVPNDNK